MDPALSHSVESLLQSRVDDDMSDSASLGSASGARSWLSEASSRGSMVKDKLSSRDWQLSKTLPDCLLYLLEEGRHSDITFVFPDEPSASIKAHKLILAGRSPVMEATFYGPLATTKKEVEIGDYTYSASLDFLKYLYTDSIELTTTNAPEVMRLSHHYRCPVLTEMCSEFVSCNLDKDNVLDVLRTASLLDLPELEQRSILFIDENASDVLTSDSFTELPRETVISILERDSLNASEIEVYRAAMAWATLECDRRQKEASIANKREVLGRIFHLIRFPLIGSTDLADTVVTDGLLSTDQLLELFVSANASTVPKMNAFHRQTPREFPRRIVFCDQFEDDFSPINALDEEITLSVDSGCALLGFILSRIHNTSGDLLDFIEGALTIINGGDEPSNEQLESSILYYDDDTIDLRLEKAVILRKNVQYNMILSALTTVTFQGKASAKGNSFQVKMGKFPALSAAVGKKSVNMLQDSDKRRTRTPLVGLLLVL